MDQRKINQITVLLLFLGFGSALIIYLTADRSPLNPFLDDPLGNKKYIRELRMIGGKANVLAAELDDWFAGLWQGESLAWTVAILTTGIVPVFRFVAHRLSAAAPPEGDKKTTGQP